MISEFIEYLTDINDNWIEEYTSNGDTRLAKFCSKRNLNVEDLRAEADKAVEQSRLAEIAELDRIKEVERAEIERQLLEEQERQAAIVAEVIKSVTVDADKGKIFLEYNSFRYNTNSKVETLAKQLARSNGVNPAEVMRAFVNMMQEYRSERMRTVDINDLDQVYSKDTVSEILNNIITVENLEVDLERDAFKKVIFHDETQNKDHYEIVSQDDLDNIITVCEDAKVLNTGTKSYARQLIDYTRYYFADKAREDKCELMKAIIHDKDDSAFFDEYCRKLYVAYNCAEEYDIFYTLMKHNYWQIKRRLFSCVVINDICLTLRGPQGVGKSFLVSALFGDVFGRRFVPAWSMESIVDERCTPALGNMLVINIDEVDTGKMGSMSGKAMADVKSRLTSDEYTYRPLYSNTVKTIPRTATFISTSNYHIYEIMNDETGMRRFFEFNTNNEEQVRFDHDLVSELKDDALRAFRSIDEDNKVGYWDVNSEVGAKITAIQKTYVKPNSAVEFVNEACIVNKDLQHTECIAPKDLYIEYCSYMKETGNLEKKFNKMNFIRKIRDKFPEAIKMKDNTERFLFEIKNLYVEPRGQVIQQPVTSQDIISELKANKAHNLSHDEEWMDGV